MNLTKILKESCVRVPLEHTDKEGAIVELVDVLEGAGLLGDRDVVLDAVLKREQTRSTGIGSGVAIPHGKCGAVKELVMAMGISREGIEFDSVDGRPVNIIMLLASPVDQTGPHIQALATISRLMLDQPFRGSLEQAQSVEEAYKLICQRETE